MIWLCPTCSGDSMMLGTLGNLTHFRCRQCGIVFNRDAKETKEEIADHIQDVEVQEILDEADQIIKEADNLSIRKPQRRNDG